MSAPAARDALSDPEADTEIVQSHFEFATRIHGRSQVSLNWHEKWKRVAWVETRQQHNLRRFRLHIEACTRFDGYYIEPGKEGVVRRYLCYGPRGYGKSLDSFKTE